MQTYRRWRTHTARRVRTPPTVRVHSRTLPTVSLHLRSLTGSDDEGRSDAIATLGDGVCTFTERPDGIPMACEMVGLTKMSW